MIAARQKPQALRRLVEQFRLRQNATAYGHHRVGGEDERAFQFFVEPQHRQRGFGFAARQPGRAGARQFSAFRRFINVGWTQRVGLDPGLVDERKPARRTGGENKFGAADHLKR